MKNIINIRNIKKGDFIKINYNIYNNNMSLSGIVVDKDNNGIVCYYNDGITRISTNDIVNIKRLTDIKGQEIDVYVQEVIKMYKQKCKIQKKLNKLNIDINNINHSLNNKKKDLTDILLKNNFSKDSLLVSVETLTSKYDGIFTSIKCKEDNNKIVVKFLMDYYQLEVICLDELSYIRDRYEKEFKRKVYGLEITNIEDDTYHIDDEWWEIAFSFDLILEIDEKPYNTFLKIISICDKLKGILNK